MEEKHVDSTMHMVSLNKIHRKYVQNVSGDRKRE